MSEGDVFLCNLKLWVCVFTGEIDFSISYEIGGIVMAGILGSSPVLVT